jgi:hypothetical protein
MIRQRRAMIVRGEAVSARAGGPANRVEAATQGNNSKKMGGNHGIG